MSKYMNIHLILIIFLFSIQVIFAYGQLESDTEFMVYKGDQYMKLFNYKEANKFFDKVLELEPNNVEALYKKANALLALKMHEEAISYYEQILNIEPQNQNTIRSLHNALVSIANFKYGFLDGVLEITVHDSQGGLIAYQRTTKFLAIKHEITENIIETWPMKKITEMNNQKFSVHQKEFLHILDGDTILGFHEIPYSDDIDIPISSSWHHQIPVQKGDVVSYVYSFFKPVT